MFLSWTGEVVGETKFFVILKSANLGFELILRSIGFAVYSSSRDEDLPDAGEVDAIYVLSEYYGRKVGYRLMNEAISRLSEYNTFFVWVFEKNERAINFYHKYGFEFDGCKKEWTLGTPVTIVRMVMKRA